MAGTNYATGATKSPHKLIDVTISSGTTSTSSGDLVGLIVVGLITPASLSSTSLTFSVSTDGTTFRTLKDTSNTNISITCDSTARQYVLTPSNFAGVKYIKVESGSSETSKTFTLVTRPIS